MIAGAELTTLSLIDALKNTNHITTLYSTDPPLTLETQKKIAINKVRRSTFPFFSAYQRMKEIERLFEESSNEDVLIISSGGLTLMPTRVSKIFLYCHSTFEGEVKFVNQKFSGIKGIYYHHIQKELEKEIEFIQDDRVHLIANSDYTKQIIKKMFKKDSKVVYPPVDIKKYTKFFNFVKENKVVTITRLSAEKNLDFAIDVMRETQLDYVLGGFAKYKNQLDLIHEIEERKTKNIILHPNLDSASKENLLSHSKVYFHTAKESFGITVVEAISAGCIPIVPDNSAHKETVPFPELRYSNKDEALKKIKEAIKGKYDFLKPKLFQHIKQFSEKSFQNRMIDIIDGSG